MANLVNIKTTIISMFPENALNDTTWEYGFKFNYDRDIKSIAYSTNFTPFTIAKAFEGKADLLITHHDAWPFMNEQKEYCNKLLEDYQLNHCFFHTPLDAAEFGASSSLAKALKMKDRYFSVPYHGKLCGVAGIIDKTEFTDLINLCEKVLCEKVRTFKNNDILCSKILICTGGGNDIESFDNAITERCDTYITGEYGMYLQHYAQFHKINLIIGSHTKTEIIGVRSFVNEIIFHYDDLSVFEIDEPSY